MSLDKNLASLAALADNWGDPGSKKPTAAALKTAEAIYFVPLSDGGVQIEIHAGGMDIEIIVSPEGTIQDVYAENAN